MAIRKPLVEVAGEIQSLQPGDSIATGADTYVATFTSTAVPGEALYVDANDAVDLAQADAAGTSKVIGLAVAGVTAASTGDVQYGGILSLTTGQWDAVAGTTGGLTAGLKYYLSDVAAGKLLEEGGLSGITQGEYVVEVGKAISTTDMRIEVRRRILR